MELRPVDLEQFWIDDEIAHRDNCFAKEAPQVALGIRMSEECVLAEFGEEVGNPMWKPPDRARRIELNKRYNDKAEGIVGIRLLPEEFPPEDMVLPKFMQIGEVFGGRYSYLHGTDWLESDIKTPEQLEAKLDEIEKADLRQLITPPDWDDSCRDIYKQSGARPPWYHAFRGPVTLACSLFGVENLIFLLLDEPELAKRFSDTIADVIIGMTEIIDEAIGAESFGFRFYDDNCCMLNAEMYEAFGYPVIKRVFDRFSPESHHERYQHSDSEMEHLLPILGRLGFNGVNFGPTITIDKIREHLPEARIDGCMAPYTFMS
ncbi:MAG: hypothetical protein FWE59_06815, partial [Oscillospiraceae bacterium]|nr:hypothetical protein [Oscillospiraceae bacterium]